MEVTIQQKYNYLYMADFIGIVSIALVTLLTLVISIKNPTISKLLFAGLIFRVFLILFGHYISPLPDSSGDATSFDGDAWRYGKNGFINLIDQYPGAAPNFLSWVIGIFYSFFGRSVLMAQSISLFFGMGSIYLGWIVAKEIWDNSTAVKAAWTIALFPSLALYSALFLREVYIVFFLLVALYGIVTWFKTYSLKSIIISIIGFTAATFFHGALALGGIVFGIIVSILTLIKFFKSIFFIKFDTKSLIIILCFSIFSYLYLSNQIHIPYLGKFNNTANVSTIIKKTEVATRGDASWPEWTTINSQKEIFYKGPIRSIYLTFAPFPWDVNKFKHVIGMLDGFLYIYLCYLILRNIKFILNDPILSFLLLIFMVYIFVFGIGVGNFGTGIRHRSKFVVILILLAAPFIKQFILYKKVKS